LDDASDDLTWNYLQELAKKPGIRVFRNVKREGLIYNRNLLIEQSLFDKVISIDDDLDFLTHDFFNCIEKKYLENSKIAIQSFRVYWSKEPPTQFKTDEKDKIISDFLGGAHVFRQDVWKQLVKYPGWYMFYGEEAFIGMQLIKLNYRIAYNPLVLCHHRVDNKGRKKGSDYYWRLRKAMRANWNNQLIFTPLRYLLFNLTKSVVKNGIQKFSLRDYRLTLSWILAVTDIIRDTPRRFAYRNLRLTVSEWNQYKLLPPAPIYWDGKS